MTSARHYFYSQIRVESMFKKLIAAVLFVVSVNANAFLVTDFSESRVNVRDIAGDGRWMIVALWQMQCVLCEQQKPSIEAFHQKYKNSNAHVVGLVTDGHEKMIDIQQFVRKRPTTFPNYVVFGDVFTEQILEETGKQFHTYPGYLLYTPDGKLFKAINSAINIDELLLYLETQFVSP